MAGVCLSFAACGGSSSGSPWIEDARVIVQGEGVTQSNCRDELCQHNDETDLAAFNGAIFLLHRTASSQVLSQNSAIGVLRSTDGGRSFESTARLPAPSGRDIRDAHFFAVGDALCMKVLARLPITSSRDSGVDTVTMQSCTQDGVTWSDPSPMAPAGVSFWRVQWADGVYYAAAYADGDSRVDLFASADGRTWTRGAEIYAVAEDTPSETELVLLPSGTLLAIVRLDGTDRELFGTEGRLRTKICRARPPYTSFDCAQEISDQRLDGPLAFLVGERLFVIARKHLGSDGRKRTSLFELTGDLEAGPLVARDWGELPSAGDTAYAGRIPLTGERSLVSWYSGSIEEDESWVFGLLHASDVWGATLDFARLAH